MSWHVEPELMDRYLGNGVDRLLAASIEMHVTQCSECRRLVAIPSLDLDRSWAGVQDGIQAPDPTWLERLLIAFRLPPTTARVVAVAPSLRLSWFAALVLVLGFAVGMTHLVDPTTATIVFGTIAPVLPVAGVAFAYGRLADPGWEIVASTPVDRFRLLLLRVVAVTATTLGLSVVTGLLLPALGFFGLWILPALALTALTLVLSSRVEVWKSAVAVVVGWGVLVAQALSSPSGRSWLFGSDSQLIFGLIAVAAGVGLIVLRETFNRGGVE